jgi:hypothetical protein
MDDLMAATVLDDLDIWTDVAVPLVAALIGGGFALLGARWGARRAARYQGEQAGRIARELRRAEREEDALLVLDAALAELDAEGDDLLRRADASPDEFSSEETRKLAGHLLTFYGEWNRLRRRVHGPGTRQLLSDFDPLTRAYKVEEVQERRKQSNDLRETKEMTRELLRDGRELREAIRDALGRLS